MKSLATVGPSKRAVKLSYPLVCSLYRAVLKQAQKFDSKPYIKFFSPLTNPVIQKVLGMGDSVLYRPEIGSYVKRVQKEFRDKRARNNEEITAAFEVLSSMKSLASSVENINVPMVVSSNIEKIEAQIKSKHKKYAAKLQVIPSLNPGTILLSHPIANSFLDRRVVMIVGNENNIVTGVVLDLPYNTTITKGNPLFPEAFWGHEIMQGGPYHVEITMPPSAFISVLHTGIVSSEDCPDSSMTQPSRNTLEPRNSLQAYSKRALKSSKLFTEIISGSMEHGNEPLYFSRVESLPKLAQKVLGKPRRNVRVYWGAMYWSTHSLQSEIEDGVWFPVTVSPSFFRPADTEEDTKENASDKLGHIVTPEATSSTRNAKDNVEQKSDLHKAQLNADESNTKLKIDRYTEAKKHISQRIHSLFRRKKSNFPTHTEIIGKQEKRYEVQGHDAQRVEPVFPPEPPMCRREPLWDQIMWSLGGEFRDIVGKTSPIVVEHIRRPSMSAISEIMEDE